MWLLSVTSTSKVAGRREERKIEREARIHGAQTKAVMQFTQGRKLEDMVHPLNRCAASRRTQMASLGILERSVCVKFDQRVGGGPPLAGERRFGAECRVWGMLFSGRGGVGELHSISGAQNLPRWSPYAQFGVETKPVSSSSVPRKRRWSASSTKKTNGLCLCRYEVHFSYSWWR